MDLEATDRLLAASPYLSPLITMAQTGIAPLILVFPGPTQPLPDAAPGNGSWVMLVGDHHHPQLGVAAFPKLRPYLRRSTICLIMADVAVPHIYRAAAELAGGGERITLIETALPRLREWRKHIDRYAPRSGRANIRLRAA